MEIINMIHWGCMEGETKEYDLDDSGYQIESGAL